MLERGDIEQLYRTMERQGLMRVIEGYAPRSRGADKVKCGREAKAALNAEGSASGAMAVSSA
jgi:hypothetical protein